MLSVLSAALRRDCLLAWRSRSDVLLSLAFFLVVVSLFPLGTRAGGDELRDMAPAIFWLAALLAGLIPLPRLFAVDAGAGTLEQMVLANEPLALIAAGRIAAHWLASAAPLLLVAPLLAMQFGLPAGTLAVLVLSLLLGTPALSALGAIAAALTLNARGGAALLALLVLPLATPVLVMGAAALTAANAGEPARAHMLLLAGLSLGMLVLAPPVVAAAWRLAVE